MRDACLVCTKTNIKSSNSIFIFFCLIGHWVCLLCVSDTYRVCPRSAFCLDFDHIFTLGQKKICPKFKRCPSASERLGHTKQAHPLLSTLWKHNVFSFVSPSVASFIYFVFSERIVVHGVISSGGYTLVRERRVYSHYVLYLTIRFGFCEELVTVRFEQVAV